MAVQMLGIKTKFTDDQGRPLIGGSVHTYYAGTSLPQDTFSDPELTVPNTNPVKLDDTGSANVFLKGTYRVRVFDRNGKFVEEQDNVDQLATVAEVFKNKGGLNAANERIDELENKTISVESVSTLLSIENPKDGLRVYVKSYHAGFGKGGGYFTYDSSKLDINDEGTIINGWVRNYSDRASLEMFGAVGDGTTDDTRAISKAFLSKVPIRGTSGSYYFYERIMLDPDPIAAEGDSNPYAATIDSDHILDFDGHGCTFVIDPKIGQPKPTVLGSFRRTGIFLRGVKKVRLSNFNIEGPSFSNLEEDTKPYIKGVQGTVDAYNTTVAGLRVENSNDVIIDNITVKHTASSFNFERINDGLFKNLTSKEVGSSFGIKGCHRCVFENLVSIDARFGFASGVVSIYSEAGEVIDAVTGKTVYTVVPNVSYADKEGVKVNGGYGIVIREGSNNRLNNITCINTASDGIRFSGDEVGSVVSNYLCIHPFRHAASCYGSGNKGRIINMTVENYGITPYELTMPSTREQALEGATRENILNFWSFLLPRSGSPVISVAEDSSMEVDGFNIYETKKHPDKPATFVKGYDFFKPRRLLDASPGLNNKVILRNGIYSTFTYSHRGGLVNLFPSNDNSNVLLDNITVEESPVNDYMSLFPEEFKTTDDFGYKNPNIVKFYEAKDCNVTIQNSSILLRDMSEHTDFMCFYDTFKGRTGSSILVRDSRIKGVKLHHSAGDLIPAKKDFINCDLTGSELYSKGVDITHTHSTTLRNCITDVNDFNLSNFKERYSHSRIIEGKSIVANIKFVGTNPVTVILPKYTKLSKVVWHDMVTVPDTIGGDHLKIYQPIRSHLITPTDILSPESTPESPIVEAAANVLVKVTNPSGYSAAITVSVEEDSDNPEYTRWNLKSSTTSIGGRYTFIFDPLSTLL